MSNTTEPITFTPIINPDALPQLIEMLEQSVQRHTETIATANRLIERLDETEDHGIIWDDCEVIIDGLNLLIEAREEDIEVQHQGIAELREAQLKYASEVFEKTGIVNEIPA
jgi:3-hydroxyacyl-CoA dehydrogenase